VATSSSAKKVAKLATKCKGKKVRFQGGTLFPVVVVLVVLLGLLTIVYARASRPSAGSGPPQLGQHWSAAYGMYVCDGWLPKLVGSKDEQSIDPATGNQQYSNKNFRLTGVNSHDDGVIDYQPFTAKATGSRAVLGVFLDTYDVKLSSSKLELPADQGGDVYDTKSSSVFAGTSCAGKSAEIKVRVWDNYADPGNFQDYITDLTNIRIKNNGMVFAIAVVPKGGDVPIPPWAADLPSLAAANGADVIAVPNAGPADTTPAGTTPAGGTTVGTTPASGSVLAPVDTAVTSTTGG
jgi:hypothetical protein